MNKIRKIILGKEPTRDAMHYEVGKPAVGGKYVIDSILEDNDRETIVIYILDKSNDEILKWKEISKNTAWIVEFSQDI